MRAPVFCVLLTVVVAGNAQNDPIAELYECRAIPGKVDRVNCYDQIMDVYSGVQSEDEPSGIESETVTPLVKATEEAAENVGNTDPAFDARNLGRKYLREAAGDDAPESLAVILADAEKDSKGRWRFALENGQVWRQIEARYLKVPDRFPVDASLIPGSLGSFALKIGDRGKPVKVRRVK